MSEGYIQSENVLYSDVIFRVTCNMSIALEVKKSVENEPARGDKRRSCYIIGYCYVIEFAMRMCWARHVD